MASGRGWRWLDQGRCGVMAGRRMNGMRRDELTRKVCGRFHGSLYKLAEFYL